MTTTKLTFDELVRLEPALRRLEADVRGTAWALRRKRRRCRNGIWLGRGRYPDYRYKAKMSAFVGQLRDPAYPHPDAAAEAVLRSSAAYATAYDHLYRLVPECRVCSCW